MSSTAAGILQLVLLVAMLAIVHRPLGDYMARVFTGTKHLAVERGFYRIVRVDPEADQRWSTYLLSLLGFSLVSVLFLFGFQRLQSNLPLSLGVEDVPSAGAFNTAVSFVTNTNWQWYSGESTMGHLVQMAGLAVQNFLSAAVRRGAPAEEEAVVTAGERTIDLARKKVTRAGADVRLTPTEWGLLEILVRAQGRLVGRKQLLHEVWGPAYNSETNYLRVSTAQLRRKLEVDPSHPKHIITEPGMGDRFEV
jgi:hypothetical protein